MDNQIEKYLFDVLESIDIIEKHVSGIDSLSAYQNDLKTIDAVERRLSIIGEALNKAIRLNHDLKISNKNKIIGLRHLLVHDYDKSDDPTIWIIIQKHLPVLKDEAEVLLKEYNGSSIN